MVILRQSLPFRASVTGTLAGFFAGLTGVGGGALLVPMLTGYLRLPQHTAHGTSLIIVIFAAAAAAAGYIWRGDVDWALVGALLGGSIVGAYGGALLVMRIPAPHLHALFGLFLLAVGIRMLFT